MEEFATNETKLTKDKLRLTVVIVVFAVTSGTSFGVYNTAVVNNLKPVVVDYLNITSAGISINNDPDTVWSIVIAAYPIGCGFGTICAAILAEKLGRKIALIVSAAFNVVGGLMCIFYLKIFQLSIGGRLFMGTSLGLGLPLASSFITEIAPVKYRGACNAALQVGFSFGDVCGMILSLPLLFGSQTLSPYALGFTAISSCFMFVALIFAPESPRYLILECNKLDRGKKAIKFYQGRVKAQEVFNEILSERDVGETMTASELKRNKNLTFFIKMPKKPLIIACCCFAFPVLSGVPIIMGYSTDAFSQNGLSPSTIPYCSLTIGLCNFISSCSCIHLIERLGRRRLVIMGVIGSFVGPLMFTILSLVNNYATVPNWFRYLLVVSLDIYALSYSFFNASCITLAAEVCSQKYRSFAMAVGNLFQMLVSTILILTYEPIKHSLGISWVFFPFNCLATGLSLIMFFALPETTGVTLTDIKKKFVISKQT